MSEGEKDYSQDAVLGRFRAARKIREREILWLAYVLDALAVIFLILGIMYIAIPTFVAARFASRMPTVIGWGFLILLGLGIAFTLVVALLTVP